ncbi:dipeptide transport ATP-binding protein DppD [Citreicella sp. SE45]|nr:dipeptide transport ATP-binding protein DppD [Citreicella sp. SE45]
MTAPLLDIDDLHVNIPTDRGDLHALRGAGLRLEAGKTLCLVGESGCGKSLTAMSLMGLLPRKARQRAGRFALMGTDYAGKAPKAWANLRGRDMAMIFQDPNQSLNPTMTVGVQMTEALRHFEKLSKAQAEDRAIAMLDRVGIADPRSRLGQYPHQFSGGQRQRLMIASALIGRPKLLIADEPTTALDVTIQAQILQVIAELQDELGLGLMLITHDLGVAAAIADEVAVMYAGRVIETGPVAQLFAAPAHPYTQGLMAAIPVPGRTRPGTPLPAIPGRVPGLIGGVTGCAFRDRCALAGDGCASDPLPRHAFASGGFVECTRPSLSETRP